jgi:hypothetical protein
MATDVRIVPGDRYLFLHNEYVGNSQPWREFTLWTNPFRREINAQPLTVGDIIDVINVADNDVLVEALVSRQRGYIYVAHFGTVYLVRLGTI